LIGLRKIENTDGGEIKLTKSKPRTNAKQHWSTTSSSSYVDILLKT